jgi:hypothetical protein
MPAACGRRSTPGGSQPARISRPDLAKATELVRQAAAEGRPVAQALTGLDHFDGVNGRVRALVGLMHT